MNMKPLKIAVCFSGQTRTWKAGLASMKHFFSPPHRYYFFGHTWDQNSWKIFDNGNYVGYVEEKLSAEALEQELQSQINFSGLLVQPQVSPTKDDVYHTWLPMIKSAALANNLKTQFEIENRIRFDVVVKTRWDVAYTPTFQFHYFIANPFSPTTLYCWYTSEFKREFRMPSLDDIMYFGSSRTMNIIDGFYHYYHTRRFFEMTRTTEFNPAMDKVGVGVMLHKWATLKNITISTPHGFFTPPVIRKTAENLKWPEMHDEIHRQYIHFGDPV